MSFDYTLLLPELVLTGLAVVLIVADLSLEYGKKQPLTWITFIGILVAMGSVWPESQAPAGQTLAGMVSSDGFSIFFKVLFLGVAALVTLASGPYLQQKRIPVGEFYVLLLAATLGMMFMAGSRDLITIYLGIELASITSYVLAGLLREDPKSNEAAIKYFLNGAMASAILLFGLSLVYGVTGETHLDVIGKVLAGNMASWPIVGVALVFLVAGFGFKIAAAPFHLWTPDAYEGAPTLVTAFFAVGPKAGAMAAVLRTFSIGFAATSHRWALLFAILSVASMFFGNLTALWQTNVKRMMAYSSIAHVGYLLVGVTVAFTVPGTAAVMFYLLAYAAMTLGAFAVILAVDAFGPGDQIGGYAGLAQRSPLLAWGLTLFFISMIGIPPTGGFMGKFYLFSAAVQNGYVWLAVIMAINSAISVGYYYGIVKEMFVGKPVDSSPIKAPAGVQWVVALTALLTLALGLWASPFLQWATTAAVLPKFF
ncbi:MAG: NADH-quinone oxidoreductase subunit N [Symbiobacteriia bacterium]